MLVWPESVSNVHKCVGHGMPAGTLLLHSLSKSSSAPLGSVLTHLSTGCQASAVDKPTYQAVLSVAWLVHMHSHRLWTSLAAAADVRAATVASAACSLDAFLLHYQLHER